MKTLLIGLDAFDPAFFESLHARNRLPHLAKYVASGGYSRFGVSNPPQSEVSWTSIASGANPGGHGIFDFVHRDPANYQPYVSLLPTQHGLGGTQFVPPHRANTLFEQAAGQGFPATSLWWPATFPARLESPVQTIPGLGAPDIDGRLGVGILYTTAAVDTGRLKTTVRPLTSKNRAHFTGVLKGPSQENGKTSKELSFEFHLEVGADSQARLTAPDLSLDLEVGRWSRILEFTFKVNLFYSLKVITRVILTQVSPDVRLYFLPLQIHPLKSPWRYATPPGFVKNTWKSCGPFLTVGWPQDTTALEEGWINDEQFLSLCEAIEADRERTLNYHLDHFDEGVLGIVFDSLDRIQHMFWRDRPDVIEAWYHKLDALVGRVEARLAPAKKQTRLVVLSDHGFTRFDTKVSLNRWLIEHDYLVSRSGPGAPQGTLSEVDWSKSQAYALGLNSLYLNLAGREGQGMVQTLAQREALTARLCGDLAAWRGPDGKAVVLKASTQAEAFEGAFSADGPDILVGYRGGYRASQDTGLGAWGENSLEPNRDHWGADHCVDASVVPGVLFCSDGLGNFPRPTYKDIPALSIGMAVSSQGNLPPPKPPQDEDQEKVNERLKSLGYL